MAKIYSDSLVNTRFYYIWVNMKTRCTNKNTVDYHRYGGRGITVCDKWLKFSGFKDDMLASYSDNLTLDRIDNNKGYSKDNCQWVTRLDQARNTRNVERAKRYEYKGETKTIREWAELFGIKRTTLDMRLHRYGYSIEKALIGKRG